MLTALFVVTRIVANPLSNLFQKQLTQRSANPVFIIAVVHAMLTAVCLLLVLVFLVRGTLTIPLGPELWVTMVICALLAVAGNVLLVHAVKAVDLSVLGPINAYKSVVGLVLGIFLIGEMPTSMGVAGTLLIVAGSYFVADDAVNEPRRHAFVRFFRERGIQLRFAALGLSATEAVFLKKAILLSSPLTTFVLWSVLGFPIAGAAVVLLSRQTVPGDVLVLRRHFRTYLWLVLTIGLMQLSTVLTFGTLHVGYSLALFQMSTLISVFLGYQYFQERHIRERLFGSVVMAAGAVLILMFGARR
jgi:drug/metabolite transporter (DMT)-like permease